MTAERAIGPAVCLLGISGSLRTGSHNRRLLHAAAHELPPGARLELWDGLRRVPPFDPDDDREPALPAVQALRNAFAAADGVLIATPEYNHSLPGQLKNALDWASRPRVGNVLDGKPVAVIGASPGAYGAVWAQAETRKILAAIGARVIDSELAVGNARHAFADDHRLADPELRSRLAEIVGELAQVAGVAG